MISCFFHLKKAGIRWILLINTGLYLIGGFREFLLIPAEGVRLRAKKPGNGWNRNETADFHSGRKAGGKDPLDRRAVNFI